MIGSELLGAGIHAIIFLQLAPQTPKCNKGSTVTTSHGLQGEKSHDLMVTMYL